MNLLQIASLLVVLAAAFGVVNHFFLRLPQAIGILVVALAVSFAAMGFDLLLPDLGLQATLRELVLGIEFSQALLEGMLGRDLLAEYFVRELPVRVMASDLVLIAVLAALISLLTTWWPARRARLVDPAEALRHE